MFQGKCIQGICFHREDNQWNELCSIYCWRFSTRDSTKLQVTCSELMGDPALSRRKKLQTSWSPFRPDILSSCSQSCRQVKDLALLSSVVMWDSRRREKMVQCLALLRCVVWKAMQVAVADCSVILKIVAEWQRQENYVHHKRSC